MIKQYITITILAFVGLAIFIGFTFGVLALSKKYSIWSKEQAGKAQLAEAQFSKQVKVEEAKANLEAQKLNAKAEVERVRGAAESIQIEGGKLTENYIKYLWIRNLDTKEKQLIYVPTEAGLPLLEAGRN